VISRVRLVLIVIGVAVPITMVVMFVGRDTAVVQELAARNTMVNRIVSTPLDGTGLQSRAAGIRITGQAFVNRPLTGWGGEKYEVPYQLYQREGELSGIVFILDRAHNKPMDLLTTSGLIGFTTYMMVWGWLGFLTLRRIPRDPKDRHFNALIAGASVALLINNLFLFDNSITMLVLALLSA
jgi:O-antigen ligase